MKAWEKALEKQIEEIKTAWKRFAKEGDCANIECRFCPIECYLNGEAAKDVVKRLNKEVEE